MSDLLPLRPLGTTGLQVSALGLGGGPIGDASLDQDAAVRLVHEALDLGVTLIDTAPSYGDSELRIGRALAGGERDRVVLSTKLGYGVEGVPDWSGECIRRGVEQALRRLDTDRLDLAHLHSCPLEILAGGEVVEALSQAVEAGKVRVAAYSGEGEALEWALASGLFGSLQFSLNPWDQGARTRTLPDCGEVGLGALTKRSLGNAVWVHPDDVEAPDLREYRRRYRELGLDPEGLDWAELCVRFAAHQPGVSSCLVGTRSPVRLRAAVEAVGRGPLPELLLGSLTDAWERRGGWPGLI